jgi:glutaredoxin
MNTEGAVRRQLVDEQGKPLSLTLYKFDGCYFCHRVISVIDELGVEVSYRDTRREPGAQDELLRVGRVDQVPCLFINGEPLYESADIIAFLRARAAA